MKRYLAILLSLVLIFGAFPVFATSSGVEAMGNFQGRLLAAGYDVNYDLILINHESAPQSVSVVLAKYIGNTLNEAVPETVTLEAGQRFSKTYTLTDITNEITSVRAFVLNSTSTIQPMIRADELNKEYESMYNKNGWENTVSSVTEGILTGKALENRFPVHETFRTVFQKAYVNGGAMLAWFDTAPEEIYVGIDRTTESADNVMFKQFKTARVINPEGKVVCYYDFSADGAADGIVFDIPEYTGEPGIWTISYVGGMYTQDNVTIGIPYTEYYGIRGDMFIGFNHLTQKSQPESAGAEARKWYLYVPETSVGTNALFLFANNKAFDATGANAFSDVTISTANGTVLNELMNSSGTDKVNVESRLHCRAKTTTITRRDAGKVWTFDLGKYNNYLQDYVETGVNNSVYWPYSKNFQFDGLYVAVAGGLPGLFCPTPDAAKKLKGGTATSSDGRILGGTVQAEARNIALDIVQNGELDITADFATELPAFIEEAGMTGVEALTVGANSGVLGAEEAVQNQNLDPNDLYLGSIGYTEFENSASGFTYRPNYENFVYSSGERDFYAAGNLAAMASLPTKLNGVYGDTGLVNRASLTLLSFIAEMSPEDMLRGKGVTFTINYDESTGVYKASEGSDYWPNRSLFTFASLIDAYSMLKDKVSPETAEVMRNAVIRMGDKMANYMANDTNQWTEFIRGHFELYMATGEERFLDYFERHVSAIGKPPVDANSFGQNSAGAFLERMAPSAQYANQCMHNLYPCYYTYRSLENRDETVFRTFEDTLKRYTNYESLNWLPVVKGGVTHSATAVMVKGKNGNYGASGGVYPNFSLGSVGFPIYARLLEYRQEDMIAKYYPNGNTHLAGDLVYRFHDVAEAMLENKMFDKANPLTAASSTVYAGPRAYEIFTQEEWVDAGNATLPIEETDKVWKYDDLFVFKKNGLYAMNFYANPHSTTKTVSAANLSYRGGLPFAIWSEGTGPVVLAQYLAPQDSVKYTDKQASPVTHYSGVHVTDKDGTTYTTAHTNGTLVAENSTGYTITQPVGVGLKYQRDAEGKLVSDGDGGYKTTTAYGTLTYKGTYNADGLTIEVSLAMPDDADLLDGYDTYQDAFITLPIFSSVQGTYWHSIVPAYLSEITQSNGNKTLNYKSTVDGAYGSMNIHTSTAATFDESSKSYNTWASCASRLLNIPLDESGNATITFEIVTEN